MLKYLLTGLYSLCVFLCHAQEGELEVASDTSVPAVYDSNLVVEDFDAIIRDQSKIYLSWKVPGSQGEFFTIERSCNGKEFETVAVIKQADGQLKLEWVDEQPSRGKNLYRIRSTYSSGQHRYSKPVSAFVGGNVAVRFYPNPVDNMLIVRSEQVVDVAIVDGNGKFRVSQNQVSGLQLLNVSSLEKGVYIIRIYNRQTNTLIQDKLIKN